MMVMMVTPPVRNTLGTKTNDGDDGDVGDDGGDGDGGDDGDDGGDDRRETTLHVNKWSADHRKSWPRPREKQPQSLARTALLQHLQGARPGDDHVDDHIGDGDGARPGDHENDHVDNYAHIAGWKISLDAGSPDDRKSRMRLQLATNLILWKYLLKLFIGNTPPII